MESYGMDQTFLDNHQNYYIYHVLFPFNDPYNPELVVTPTDLETRGIFPFWFKAYSLVVGSNKDLLTFIFLVSKPGQSSPRL
jgi:hypothetical protein